MSERARTAAPETLTAKGQRSADRVLRAATTVLARDGHGGATVARIATEAGVAKRNVLYYYGTREALLAAVVRTVGERVAAHIDATVPIDADAPALADTLVETVWSSITTAPELARAYFALIADPSPVVQAALAELKQAFQTVITGHLKPFDAAAPDLDSLSTYTLGTLRGLLLEWTETGDTTTINTALAMSSTAIANELRSPKRNRR